MSNTGIKYDYGKPMLSLISTEMWEAVLDELGRDATSGLSGALVMCNRAAHVSSKESVVVDYLLAAIDLLLNEFGPMACMTECARAMEFGCKKYERNNWKGGMQALRLIDAMHRHLFAAIDGEDTDPESGAKHFGCALFGIQCILHYADQGLPVWTGYPWAVPVPPAPVLSDKDDVDTARAGVSSGYARSND